MLRNPISGQPLPKGWGLAKVDDVKAEQKHACVAGPFGSSISSKYFQNQGIPVIRGNNLTLAIDKFIPHDFAFVSPKRAKKYIGQHVKANDLVFTCWGTLGQVGIIPEDGPFNEYIISNKQLKLRVNEEIVNPTFLYYYFSSEWMVKYINNIAIGAAVPGINLGLLKNLPVVLPPRNIQDKISEYLDWFYLLIENNNQRIQLLEEMAEEIYKEWFVRLRFPGYEGCTFYDKDGNVVPHGTPGALPEGWRDGILEDVVKIEMGQSPKSEYYNSNSEGMPFHQGVTNFNRRYPDHSTFCTDPKKVADKGDILLSVRAPVGRLNIADRKLILGRGLCGIRHRKGFQNYAYYLLQDVFKIEDSFGNGAVFNAVSKSELSKIKVIIPHQKVEKKFQEYVKPLDQEILLLTQKNQVLQETRDLLLPRLISGKLNVEELDIAEPTT